ncbi:UvrD-helicase domain-containing protein [bacterium]|nr:UvrD-helicase domain-containing protein [bacterium]
MSHSPRTIDWEKELNPRQLEAVTTTEGPVLVLAGAGSGKTRVIVYRLAYLHLERRVSPRQCLAMTFTNKAAGEMAQRAQGLCHTDAPFPISTFHSFCARWLRRWHAAAGVSRDFIILDTGDVQSLFTTLARELQLPADLVTPRQLASAISYAKNHLMDAAAFAAAAKGPRQEAAARVFAAYEARLKQLAALDFDDLLLLTLRTLESDASAREATQRQYRYLLLDEYQDTNLPQDRIAAVIAAEHRNICAVGDDDQLIYRWRGALPRNILEFDARWRGAKVIRLEENYRSTEVILSAANALVTKNVQRRGKRLFTRRLGGEPIGLLVSGDEQEEAAAVLAQIKELVAAGRRPGEIAVFYRTNAQSRPLEEQMLLSGIPYQIVGGLRFYERKEVKDILAYLRLIHNSADDLSFSRIVNLPRRGIGEATVGRLAELARERGLSLYATARAVVAEKGRDHRTLAALGRFVDLVEALRQESRMIPLTSLIGRVVRGTGYEEHLKNTEGELAKARLENLSGLEAAAAEILRSLPPGGEVDPLGFFLERVALLSDVDELADDAEAVLLMTVHTAKGLEFPVVFVVGLEEGLFPHQLNLTDEENVEEERRLFYVAMTRAKERLFLSHAYARFAAGRTSAQSPSRFLSELPREHLATLSGMGRGSAARAPRPFYLPQAPAGGVQVGFNSRGPRPARPPVVGPLSHHFAVGDRVTHPRFGGGRVLSTSGAGEHLKVTVDFGRGVVKTLVQRFAKLSHAS